MSAIFYNFDFPSVTVVNIAAKFKLQFIANCRPRITSNFYYN